MKSLSKDKVLRWVSGQQSPGGSGGGGGSVDVAGYATQIWTEQNYINKEFFSSLFKAYDANGNEVLPNDTETTIDNIKAMFGFWTEQYVSALGQGTGGGGGGGASALSDLLDVEINNPTNGQSLVYDSALSKWVNAAGSGVDMDTVWRYLGQSSTQQIDISHLVTALSGYALTSQIPTNNNQLTNGAGYITSSALTGYATQAWVGANYVSIEFFGSLFKAYDANGNEVLPNDTETTIDNIKAMFGFWTEQYVSALGQGTGGGGGGGASALSDLLDVEINNPTNGQSLVYDSALSKWVNAAGSGVDMDTVWRYLGQSSTQQIDISHLTTALSGYALKSGNVATATKLQTARTIWGQSFDGTANVSGTLSGVSGINFSSSGHFKIDSYGNFKATTNTDNNTWNVIRYDGNGALTVNASSGNTTVGGDLTVNGGDLTVNEPNSSGASAIWFQSGGTTYGNLRVKPSNGEFYFYQGTANGGQSSVWVNAGGFYAYGQVVSLSDERDKNVMGDVSLNVEQIANAPAIRFMWKDGRDDKSMQAGSIAQYWHKVLPEVIREKDDRLSLSYGVAALVSSIITARKVVDHERRIKELEEENKELKMKLKIA